MVGQWECLGRSGTGRTYGGLVEVLVLGVAGLAAVVARQARADALEVGVAFAQDGGGLGRQRRGRGQKEEGQPEEHFDVGERLCAGLWLRVHGGWREDGSGEEAEDAGRIALAARRGQRQTREDGEVEDEDEDEGAAGGGKASGGSDEGKGQRGVGWWMEKCVGGSTIGTRQGRQPSVLAGWAGSFIQCRREGGAQLTGGRIPTKGAAAGAGAALIRRTQTPLDASDSVAPARTGSGTGADTRELTQSVTSPCYLQYLTDYGGLFAGQVGGQTARRGPCSALLHPASRVCHILCFLPSRLPPVLAANARLLHNTVRHGVLAGHVD